MCVVVVVVVGFLYLADWKEAEGICERVTPRLNHANSAVVLAAVRVGHSSHHLSINSTVFVYCKRASHIWRRIHKWSSPL